MYRRLKPAVNAPLGKLRRIFSLRYRAVSFHKIDVKRSRPISRVLCRLPWETLRRRPFIWDLRCRRSHTAYPTVYPEGPDAGRVSLSYSASLRRGFAVPAPVARHRGGLLPRLFTLACARRPSAVCFLWHFPSGRPARALPGLLPCAARTFLTGFRPRGRPAGSGGYYTPNGGFFQPAGISIYLHYLLMYNPGNGFRNVVKRTSE